MRRLFVSTLVLAVVLGIPFAHAQSNAPSASVDGRWVVTGGEHDGKPMDSLKGGIMTVNGTAFEIRTASGNMLKGTMRLDTTSRPAQMDLLHADGTRWLAIYALTDDTLTINYVDASGKDPRPTAFKTSDKTEESIVALRRERR